MLAGIFTKTILDRWRGMAIGTGVVAILLLFMMFVYGNLDIGVYTELPEALRAIVGVPEDADFASLAISVIFTSYGAMALVGIVIASGTALIAGEESAGTLGLLLGNPKSRTSVVLSKAASLVALAGLVALGLWGAAHATAAILSVDLTGVHVAALAVHLFVNMLFYGFLAMAIGAWTGSKGAAAGISAGVMVVSYVAVGLLPLIEGWESVAKAFPWYYFSGGQPMTSGIDWSDLAVLAAGIVVFVAIAVVGFKRRDLKGQSVGVTLLDRLRRHPATKRFADAVGGGVRVSRLWVKTITEYQWLLIVVALLMFLMMGVALGPMYGLLPDSFTSFTDDLPEALLAAVGGGDLSTPEGWYQIENFGLMAPLAALVVGILMGGRALAGEEERRTMGLLLANPIKRSKIAVDKAWAMVLGVVFVGFATFAGVALGSLIAGLGMNIGHVAAASLLATLLGLVFGGFAFALSAATGRVSVSVAASAGAAVVAYLTNAFLPLNESLAGLARWSPFYYYLDGDPLKTGMNWSHGAILAGLALGLLALAVILFEKRDLRQRG